MSNTEAILEFLDAAQKPCCDDCISSGAHVEPRQQVNTICRRLAQKGTISRTIGVCDLCARQKKVNATPLIASQAQRQGQPLSIESLRNQLDRFCKALVGKRGSGPSQGLASLI